MNLRDFINKSRENSLCKKETVKEIERYWESTLNKIQAEVLVIGLDTI